MSSLVLRPLVPADERSFLAAIAESRHEPGAAFALKYDEGESFLAYLRKHEAWARGENLPENYVPGAFYVGVVDGEVVGRVSIRFQLNDFLFRVAGHVGYAVRPSQRRRGYATQMLQLALPLCRAHGITRALLTCDPDNHASRIIIERAGGIADPLPDVRSGEPSKLRYWIPTA